MNAERKYGDKDEQMPSAEASLSQDPLFGSIVMQLEQLKDGMDRLKAERDTLNNQVENQKQVIHSLQQRYNCKDKWFVLFIFD